MNSMTTVISEKAVWLENNMPRWLVYCNNDGIDDVHDVMSVVLAHLSPRGVEELYSHMLELTGSDGVRLQPALNLSDDPEVPASDEYNREGTSEK